MSCLKAIGFMKMDNFFINSTVFWLIFFLRYREDRESCRERSHFDWMRDALWEIQSIIAQVVHGNITPCTINVMYFYNIEF